MSSPRGNQLREPHAGEQVQFEPVNGGTFTLRPSRQKILRDSDSPVLFFDVFTAGEERVGTASLILAPDADHVRNLGHVCATLSEQAAIDADLLQRVAGALLLYVRERGIQNPFIIVPSSDNDSLQACHALGPRSHGECEIEQRSYQRFDYGDQP